MAHQDALLTKTEIIKKLKVSLRTVERLEQRGMPVIRTMRRPRYDWQEIKKWMKEHERADSSQ